MGKRWYVVKAVSGREDKCREGIQFRLKSQGLTDFVENLLIPVEHVTEVKRGKRVTSKHKLYPGYIYVLMEPTEPVLEAIRSIDGVTGFLGADPALPDALTAEEAERIVKISTAATPDEQRAAIIQIPYEIGDKIRVREGTFAGMDGVVDDINPTKGTLRVLITVFGRQTPIELEVWQVEELG